MWSRTLYSVTGLVCGDINDVVEGYEITYKSWRTHHRLWVPVFESWYFHTVPFIARELSINYTQTLQWDGDDLGLTLVFVCNLPNFVANNVCLLGDVVEIVEYLGWMIYFLCPIIRKLTERTLGQSRRAGSGEGRSSYVSRCPSVRVIRRLLTRKWHACILLKNDNELWYSGYSLKYSHSVHIGRWHTHHLRNEIQDISNIIKI